MSHYSAGGRIFSDWQCECGENFSTNSAADVEAVECPGCGRSLELAPIRAELERVRLDFQKEKESAIVKGECVTGRDTEEAT